MASNRQLSGPHMLWSAGHALVVLGAAYELFNAVLFRTAPKAHRLALFGALISWGIVVFKSQGVPQPNMAYVRRALLDENAQYLLLVGYWWTQKPIVLSIVPFATFSVFHILTFVRTTFLPKPVAAPKDGRPSSTPPTAGQNLAKQLQTLVKQRYEAAMLTVSYVEILIMVRLIVGVFVRWNGPLSILIFATFLRLRYYLSPATRKAFATCNAEIDKVLSHQSCPGVVKQGVNVARDGIIRFAQSALPMPSAQQPQPAAAAAAARPNNAAR